MFTEIKIKALAKKLRASLAGHGVKISHAQSLEIISEMFGHKSWNHFSASLNSNLPSQSTVHERLPEGWQVANNPHVGTYNFGQFTEASSLKSAVFIKSKTDENFRFATIMQTIDAKNFKGRLIKFAAEVKSIDATNASLWVRADGSNSETVAFENMIDTHPPRALAGTNDWTQLSLAIAIPENAALISSGMMLQGAGEANFRELEFEIISDDANSFAKRAKRNQWPVNLKFNEHKNTPNQTE